MRQSERILPQAGKTQTLSAISAAAQSPQHCLGFPAISPISATLSPISSGSSPGTASSLERLAGCLPLGWSHYVTLMSVSDPEARRLAREGQVVEKASDLIEDPVVLEVPEQARVATNGGFGREGGACRRGQAPGEGSAGMRGAFGRRGVRASAHPVDLAIADLDEDGLADGSLRAASPLARAGRSPGDSC